MSTVLKLYEFDLDGHHIRQELVWYKNDHCTVWLTWIDGNEWPYKCRWLKGHTTRPCKSQIRTIIKRNTYGNL